jgi:hypothetical protein
MAQGWAFLVARGRRLGYRAILVPDFIAENRENGYLTENVRGAVDGSDRPRVEKIVAPASGQMVLAYRTHRVTHGDLDDTGDRDAGGLVTDEHGRPLDILYGLATRDQMIDALDEADLHVAKTEALPAYRRFLAGEAGFSSETSEAFPLRSVATGRTKTAVRPAVPSAVRPAVATAVRPAVSGSRLWTIVIGVLTVAIVATLVKMWLGSPSSGMSVDKPLECNLRQADDGLTCDIPVHVAVTGSNDRTTVEATADEQAAGGAVWSVSSDDCRVVGDDGSCTLHVTVEAQAHSPRAEHTITLTLASQDPHHTMDVHLTAHAAG